jgi:predicted RNA binding protein YcfA (HicA-like mRNA interferase family)
MRVEELLRRARAAGWTATLCGSGHFRLEHPDAGRPVIVPATPSDRRWHLNALAAMRRALPPEPKPVQVRPRAKRRPPTQPKPRPMLRIEMAPEEVSLPLPPRRIAGGPQGWRSPWSRLW